MLPAPITQIFITNTTYDSGVSFRLAAGDPGSERRDLLLWPGAVARHAARLEAFQDRVRVLADVGVLPQVEGEAHRLAVGAPEQRLDVLGVPDRVAGGRQGDCGFVVGFE